MKATGIRFRQKPIILDLFYAGPKPVSKVGNLNIHDRESSEKQTLQQNHKITYHKIIAKSQI